VLDAVSPQQLAGELASKKGPAPLLKSVEVGDGVVGTRIV
jgi:hypothetical protein